MASGSKLRVLLVGASIAGPTAAYWFAKAGASVTIIERFPGIRKGGQSVDIRTVGVTVMRKMPGLEEAVRANRAPVDKMSVVGSNGCCYGTLQPTGNPNQQSLISEYEILRGDLNRILYNTTKDHKNIRYVFGEQVASMQQPESGDGPVTVQFANGYPTAEFDLVVACDGATSRTRAIGLETGVRDHMHTTNSWLAYFSVPGDLLKGKEGGHGYSAPGGRAIIMVHDPKADKTRLAIMGIHPPSDREALVPLRNAVKEGDDAVKAYIADHYSGAGWKSNDAVAAMMEAEDLYVSESAQVKLPTLSRGRFVLVGDAGYAPGPIGTGTSLAMTGAYVLAGEVSKNKGNLGAALKGYEEAMRPLIDDLQKIPSLVPWIFAPQTAWAIWLRNIVFAILCRTRMLDFAQKFGGEAFAGVDKHKVPEYTWNE